MTIASSQRWSSTTAMCALFAAAFLISAGPSMAAPGKGNSGNSGGGADTSSTSSTTTGNDKTEAASTSESNSGGNSSNNGKDKSEAASSSETNSGGNSSNDGKDKSEAASSSESNSHGSDTADTQSNGNKDKDTEKTVADVSTASTDSTGNNGQGAAHANPNANVGGTNETITEAKKEEVTETKKEEIAEKQTPTSIIASSTVTINSKAAKKPAFGPGGRPVAYGVENCGKGQCKGPLPGPGRVLGSGVAGSVRTAAVASDGEVCGYYEVNGMPLYSTWKSASDAPRLMQQVRCR